MNRGFSYLRIAVLMTIASLLEPTPSEGGSFRLMWTDEASIAEIHAALEPAS